MRNNLGKNMNNTDNKYQIEIQNDNNDNGNNLRAYYKKRMKNNKNILLNTESTEAEYNINSSNEKYIYDLFNSTHGKSIPIEKYYEYSYANNSPFLQKSTMSSFGRNSNNSFHNVGHSIIDLKKKYDKK
jgi:hypothetical protein